MSQDYLKIWVGNEGAKYRAEVVARQGFNGTKPLADNPTIDEVREVLRLHGAKTVLEVGCGWGRLACGLIEEFDVAGCDVSTEMLRLAPEELDTFWLDIAAPRLNPALVGRYDAVFCRGVLHYMSENKTAMENAARNLDALAIKKAVLWEYPEVCAQFSGDKFDLRPIERKQE